MKIEVTAKEIKNLYDEFNGIEWILERQSDSYQAGTNLRQFGIKIEGLSCAAAYGMTQTTQNDLLEELTAVTLKFLERRRREIVDRFAELKLSIE